MNSDSDLISPLCKSTRTQEKRPVMRNGEPIGYCAGCDYMCSDLAVACHVGTRWPLIFS